MQTLIDKGPVYFVYLGVRKWLIDNGFRLFVYFCR